MYLIEGVPAERTQVATLPYGEFQTCSATARLPGPRGVDAYYDADGVTANQQGVKYAGADALGSTPGGDYDYVTVKWS